MSKTNLEHYKDQLKEILLFKFDNPRAAIKLIREKYGCQIKVERGEHATDAILEWMAQPYKEPILDEDERKYLADVIRPFKDRVKYIAKIMSYDEFEQRIKIVFYNGYFTCLPYFKANMMYEGMELDKSYTLEELGL